MEGSAPRAPVMTDTGRCTTHHLTPECENARDERKRHNARVCSRKKRGGRFRYQPSSIAVVSLLFRDEKNTEDAYRRSFPLLFRRYAPTSLNVDQHRRVSSQQAIRGTTRAQLAHRVSSAAVVEAREYALQNFQIIGKTRQPAEGRKVITHGTQTADSQKTRMAPNMSHIVLRSLEIDSMVGAEVVAEVVVMVSAFVSAIADVLCGNTRTRGEKKLGAHTHEKIGGTHPAAVALKNHRTMLVVKNQHLLRIYVIFRAMCTEIWYPERGRSRLEELGDKKEHVCTQGHKAHHFCTHTYPRLTHLPRSGGCSRVCTLFRPIFNSRKEGVA